mmetsp:Transcript_11978/g.21693  ORF Transcript_11978/g.21693 Transcript_11978/m.21693 type:complete len:101 (-) Transcript_11978:175-477(-)
MSNSSTSKPSTDNIKIGFRPMRSDARPRIGFENISTQLPANETVPVIHAAWDEFSFTAIKSSLGSTGMIIASESPVSRAEPMIDIRVNLLSVLVDNDEED